jgi:hypothetical protein
MKLYGIDFGGTNLRIGAVDPKTGEIIGDVFARDISNITTNEELTDIINSQITDSSQTGISAAGDVDEDRLVIKKSPNSRIRGEITFGKTLKEKGHPVSLTNDMKAAVQAAAKYGEGKGFENVLLATYSSGYNCAVVRKGINASQAEFGHFRYKDNGDLFCGCGEKAHLEIYISGNGAAAMAKQFFLTTKITDHPILQYALEDYNKEAEKTYKKSDLSDPEIHAKIVCSVSSKHVYQAFASDPEMEPQKSIQKSQAGAVAASFGMMNSAFNPLDIMVLMGSQTKDWDILFKPAIELYHNEGLQLSTLRKPSIVRTGLPEIGVQGAAAYFLVQSVYT